MLVQSQKPQTAAMIDATTDVALFRTGRAVDICDMMGIGEINAVNTDYWNQHY